MDASYSGGAETMACVSPSQIRAGGHFHRTNPILLSAPSLDDKEQQSPKQASLPSVACHSVPDCHFISAQRPENYALSMQPCMLVKGEQQQFWPSPPLGPWDYEGGTDCQDVSSSFGHHYAGTSVSPDSWPCVDAGLLQQGKGFENQPLSGQCEELTGLCTPTSATSSLPVRTYELSGLPSSVDSLEADVLSPEDFLIGTPKTRSPPRNPHDVHSVFPREASADALTTGAKLDEPYAKLIYRAFMSRTDYAMTLQDIYQWFRENTTKAVSAKGGWQNSIRHNLSMNAAFTERHRKDDHRDFSSSMDEPKRTNEWVLEDWAVYYGVQSTTRYRKGNSRRRASARPASQSSKGSTQHSAKRAMSGPKGGCAARDSRLRGRAFYHGKPAGRYNGVDQDFIPPRRWTHPGIYSSEPATEFDPDSDARLHATSMYRGYDGPRPCDTPQAMTFPLVIGENSQAQGMSNMGRHCSVMMGIPCRGDDAMAAKYAMPAQSGFLYGFRDVDMGYLDEQLVAEESGSIHLFKPIENAVYDWSDGSE